MWKETAATEPPKWKETAASELPKTTPPVPSHNRSRKRNCARYWTGWRTRDIFRQNRELKEVLFRRETETRELRNRNAELEELVRKFAPMLMDAATAMGSAAKNEKPDTQPQFAPQ